MPAIPPKITIISTKEKANIKGLWRKSGRCITINKHSPPVRPIRTPVARHLKKKSRRARAILSKILPILTEALLITEVLLCGSGA
jgi:hypothetical protein